jgi:glucosamine-6-phosphate isomerase
MLRLIKAKSYEDMSKKAAAIIAAQVVKKPDCVLGLATGSTPIGTYEELVKMYKDGLLDFSGVSVFNLDEYYGTPITDPNSYYYFMHDNLFNHVNIVEENTNIPNGMAPDALAECKAYEAAIKAAGGVDLQLLGIGPNGHIGFNEPDDVFVTETQHVKLTDSTIDANARFYASREEVPTTALTMGIGTIMKAKSVLLIAAANKKDIVEKAVYGPVTPQVPASVLQYHKDATFILVEE